MGPGTIVIVRGQAIASGHIQLRGPSLHRIGRVLGVDDTDEVCGQVAHVEFDARLADDPQAEWASFWTSDLQIIGRASSAY